MAFRVRFTGDPDWPIEFDDDIVPLKGKAKGFRIHNCSAFTNKVIEKPKDWRYPKYHEYEAIDGFWVNASSAITDSEGIVVFS